jgi:hypothetical protein
MKLVYVRAKDCLFDRGREEEERGRDPQYRTVLCHIFCKNKRNVRQPDIMI